MLNQLNENPLTNDTILDSIKSQSLLNKNSLSAFVANHLTYYFTSIILTYVWSSGFLAGMCLLIQMISGIFLVMYYTAHADLDFSSVEYIMKDVSNGLLLRYTHINGASMLLL